MSQHLFRCVYAYKVNISRARQQRNRWPKQIFFGEVTLLPHLFCRPRAVYLFVRRLFWWRPHVRGDFFVFAYAFFPVPATHISRVVVSTKRPRHLRLRGMVGCYDDDRSYIQKVYRAEKQFFEKNDKKKFENVCTFRNYAYLCIRNHENSSSKS